MNFPQNLKYKQYAISKAETEFYSTSISLAQHEQDQNASQDEKKDRHSSNECLVP